MIPKPLKAITLFCVLCFGAFFSYLWYFVPIPLASPLGLNHSIVWQTSSPSNTADKKIYGYLPYWNLKSAVLQPELTQLSYFGVRVEADGSLSNGEYPGYQALNSDSFLEVLSQAQEKSIPVELVIAQFDRQVLQDFLGSQTAQEKFFVELDTALLAYPFAGVNIDFELSGAVEPEFRSQMTQFMQKLRRHTTSKHHHLHLSIAMYASAAQGDQLWDVAAIGQEVDAIIVMAYDFHRPNSIQAGPVAPLFGGKKNWDHDITNHLKQFLKVVESKKIILGLPFYGYEWQTTSRDAQSHTFPDSGATASIKRVNQLIASGAELDVQEHWNEEALSPYISYVKDGKTYVIYYENSRSLSYKIDYVNQLDLGGIAIWALGYEGDDRELWNVIDSKL